MNIKKFILNKYIIIFYKNANYRFSIKILNMLDKLKIVDKYEDSMSHMIDK